MKGMVFRREVEGKRCGNGCLAMARKVSECLRCASNVCLIRKKKIEK